MNEFEVDILGYKQQAAEFFRALPKLKAEAQIEGGLRALRLAYISLRGSEDERYQAELVLVLADRKADERRAQLSGEPTLSELFAALRR